MSREQVEALWKQIGPDIELLGGMLFHRSNSGSIYVKFKNNGVGNLRISDHRITNLKIFNWNLNTKDFPEDDPRFVPRMKSINASPPEAMRSFVPIVQRTSFNSHEASLMVQALKAYIIIHSININALVGHGWSGREAHDQRMFELGLLPSLKRPPATQGSGTWAYSTGTATNTTFNWTIR